VGASSPDAGTPHVLGVNRAVSARPRLDWSANAKSWTKLSGDCNWSISAVVFGAVLHAGRASIDAWCPAESSVLSDASASACAESEDIPIGGTGICTAVDASLPLLRSSLMTYSRSGSWPASWLLGSRCAERQFSAELKLAASDPQLMPVMSLAVNGIGYCDTPHLQKPRDGQNAAGTVLCNVAMGHTIGPGCHRARSLP
jgi:hypothetical protein